MTTVAQKSKLLDTVTGISATETDSTVYDLRGMEGVRFQFLSSLNTGFSSGSVFFKGSILGCATKNGTFVPTGIESAELVVDVPQYEPAEADAEGTILPRFVKVKWTETGSMTSFTGTCRVFYSRPRRGKSVDHGAVSG
jgi:hypothetical protein